MCQQLLRLNCRGKFIPLKIFKIKTLSQFSVGYEGSAVQNLVFEVGKKARKILDKIKQE